MSGGAREADQVSFGVGEVANYEAGRCATLLDPDGNIVDLFAALAD